MVILERLKAFDLRYRPPPGLHTTAAMTSHRLTGTSRIYEMRSVFAPRVCWPLLLLRSATLRTTRPLTTPLGTRFPAYARRSPARSTFKNHTLDYSYRLPPIPSI
jgi:hypothetical protein